MIHENYKFSEHKKSVPSMDSSIQEFFRHFGRSLSDGDRESLMNMWSSPALILSDEMSLVVKSREEIGDFFAGVKEDYNERDIFEAIPEVLRIDWATSKIAIVDVRWPYTDVAGNEFGEESSVYTLELDHGAFKIRAAIMKGETAKSA